MLMVAAAAVVLWQAGTMKDMARCRTVRAGDIGPEAVWQSDGKGWLWISIPARASGRLELQCRISVTPGTDLVLELDRAAVSFQRAHWRDIGSGVTVIAPGVRWELLRVAGEDWVETQARRGVLTPGGPQIVVTIAALDRSGRDSMRIDIRGLRLVTADSSLKLSSGDGAPSGSSPPDHAQ